MSDMEIPPFGACMGRARTEAGLTHFDMADMTGIIRNNISRFECNYRSPLWASAYRIIVGCALDLSFFFPEDLVLKSAAKIQARRRAARRQDQTDAR